MSAPATGAITPMAAADQSPVPPEMGRTLAVQTSRPYALPYRADIDGLRAVAVLAVLAFHFGSVGGRALLRGGFAGVDCFFVISGFLIARLIRAKIDRNQFSLIGFYARRIRRLLPALLVVLLATLALGAVLLLPSDLRHLSRATMSVLLLFSNFMFWRQSGYFDRSAALNPLLHTWSLSVEEQFYLIFPALLILLRVRSPGTIRGVLAALFLLSLAGCIIAQRVLPGAAFYLAPFRAWEFLAGALLTLGIFGRPNRTVSEASGIAGLFLLAGCLAFMEGIGFPGWKALIPVASSCLLIYAGSGDHVPWSSRVLSLRPIVYVGLLSYSLYLWHWPMLVFLRFVFDLAPPAWALIGSVVTSFVLASATYHFVERPLRFRTRVSPLAVVRIGIATSIAMLAVAAFVGLRDGWSTRVTSLVAEYDAERDPIVPLVDCQRDPGIAVRPGCTIGAAAVRATVLVWGDSHALALAPALDTALGHLGVRSAMALHSACPPLFGIDAAGTPGCVAQSQALRQQLANRPEIKTIILAAAWWGYSSKKGPFPIARPGASADPAAFAPALRDTIASLQQSGRSVILIATIPGAPFDVPLASALAVRDAQPWPAPLTIALYRERHREFFEAVDGLPSHVSVIWPSAWLCNSRECSYRRDTTLLYRDDGHLSLAGSAYIAPRLERALAASGLGVAAPDPLRPHG